MPGPLSLAPTPKAAPRSAVSRRWDLGAALEEALAALRAEAAKQRDTFANEPVARALEWAARQVESALQEKGDQLLSLREAAAVSGYAEDHLARMVRQGKIPDLRPPGYQGRIVIRLRDLPIKPGHRHIPGADVHEPASRLLRGKERLHGEP